VRSKDLIMSSPPARDCQGGLYLERQAPPEPFHGHILTPWLAGLTESCSSGTEKSFTLSRDGGEREAWDTPVEPRSVANVDGSAL